MYRNALIAAACAFAATALSIAPVDAAKAPAKRPVPAKTAPRPVTPAGPVAVKISNFTFGPKVVTVKVGQTITWTNDDDIPHTVVATDKSFRSKVLDTGQSFSFTVTKPGAIAYFCSLHPMMTGKIVVTAR